MTTEVARLRRRRSPSLAASANDDAALAGSAAGQAPVSDELADWSAGLPRPAIQSLADAVAQVLLAGDEPLRAAFLARSLTALARVVPRLDSATLGDAVGQPSDYAVLLRVLQEPAALATLEAGDPLAEAYLRGLEIDAEILRSEGGVMTVEEVAKHLGVTRQAVDKRRRAGHLLALPIGRHRYAYPAWQFDPSGVLAGFEDVMDEFFAIGPWTRAAFFLGANTSLDSRRPLDELRRGNIDDVRRAAGALGQHGAT